MSIIINGKERKVPFPLSEYRTRLANIKEEMKKNGIDMLYISSPESLFYVSGYQARWYRANSGKKWYQFSAGGIALHADYDYFIHYEAPVEKKTIERYSIAENVRIFGDEGRCSLGEQYGGVTAETSFVQLVVSDLQNEGWAGGTVALELASYKPSPLVSSEMKKQFEKTGSVVVNGTEIIKNLRGKKSSLELEYIIKAGKVLDQGIAALRGKIKPGMSELEIQGLVYHEFSKQGGEIPGIAHGIYSQNSFYVHQMPNRDVKLEQGGFFYMDLAGVYNRYHVNASRIFSVGRMNEKSYNHPIVDAYLKSKGSRKIVEDALEPGMRAHDLLTRLKDYYRDLGVLGSELWIGGYEMGIAFPPDWCGPLVYGMHGTEIDYNLRFDPGTVVNFEQGYFIIDTLVFTQDRAFVLSETPWDIIEV